PSSRDLSVASVMRTSAISASRVGSVAAIVYWAFRLKSLACSSSASTNGASTLIVTLSRWPFRLAAPSCGAPRTCRNRAGDGQVRALPVRFGHLDAQLLAIDRRAEHHPGRRRVDAVADLGVGDLQTARDGRQIERAGGLDDARDRARYHERVVPVGKQLGDQRPEVFEPPVDAHRQLVS